jgi:histidinol phosphatase-like PHP family hydrolase
MIDLHTHSIFSDGVLIPSELVRRALYLGIKAIGITDHGDASNIDFIIPRIVAVAKDLNRVLNIKVIPGIEITHVPPELIAETVKKARSLGAQLVLVHGETIIEPVAQGTNLSAIEAGIDILAHPGLITEQEVLKAKENHVLLEISARKGHCLSNGHVARTAMKYGAQMVVNTDTHGPDDLIDTNMAKKIVLSAGLTEKDFEDMQANASKLI